MLRRKIRNEDSDEEIANLTNFDEEIDLEDTDDDTEDVDYQCDEIEFEGNPTDSMQIIDSSSFANAVNVSMNVGDLGVAVNEEESELPASSSAQHEPKATTSLRSTKRAPSPLPSVEPAGPRVKPSSGGFNGGNLGNIEKDSSQFKNILWRKRCMQLHVNEVAFRGKADLPAAVKNLKTPLDFFNYFFTNELVELISIETNRAAIAENVNSQFKVDEHTIRRYIGILIFMSIFRYPNLEAHWSEYGFRHIPDCMSKNKFEQIKKYLSFNDESKRVKKGEEGYDPIFRIRKVVTHLIDRFDSIPKSARLCIDEQMCATKMVHHLRQYLPAKPHKWGVKFYVLCDTNGYSYRFEIYTGAKNDEVIPPGSPDLGTAANVVIRLSQTIPDFKNHILYFDNYYTSLPLMVYLRARGIYSLGTVRANRIPNCKLPVDNSNELKNAARGYSTEFIGSAYGVDITTVLWKDTKNVRLCSTYVGTKPLARTNLESQLSKIARYSRKQKSYENIDCPQIIHEYNKHMGGVDLMDSYMGRNGLKIKTQDMATRIFYHLLDMTITNAFVLYRRVNSERSQKAGENIKSMKMYEFRLNIAKELCTSAQRKSVGRPLSVPQQSTSSGIGKKAIHPPASVRFDEISHFPEWGAKKSCKFCKKSDTHTFCTKCNIHLCYSSAKNCFKAYHVKT